MADTFTKQVIILEPECDINKKLTLSSIMRHSQQMGSDHLAERGLGYNKLHDAGMVFLVTKMLITVQRRPCFGEVVRMTTVPRQAKGVQFIRDTYFETADGERLLEVSIGWVLINPETRKILRPVVFDVYGFTMNPNEGETITGYKLKAPEGRRTMHLRQVKYSDLDYNRHVNNAVYADIICDSVPLGAMLYREIRQFGIIYHHEATVGQVLDIGVVENAGGYYLAGDVMAGKCFEAELLFHPTAKK